MKWSCKVCGYVYEGNEPPEFCPVCKVGKDKFERLEETPQWTDVHTLGVAQGMDERVVAGLRKQYEKECIEAGAYMAMARQAEVEQYARVGEDLKKVLSGDADAGSYGTSALTTFNADTLDATIAADGALTELAYVKWLYNLITRFQKQNL